MPHLTTNDGVRLRFLDEGQGRTVVLIAGFTAPAESWTLQVPALKRAGYRVVSLDRRSHGASQNPWFGQRMARHGKDLEELLRHLDLEDVVLVGGSMGASAIWAYADLFGTERLKAAICVDQTPKMVNDDTWPHGFYGLTRQNIGTFFEDGIPDTGRGLAPATAAERTLRLMSALDTPLRMTDPKAPETGPLLQDHAEADWRDVVARFAAPALFVAGRDSQFWPCDHAVASAQSSPAAQAVVLEDCGHAANIDQPEAFNAAVLRFLAAL